MKRAGLLNDGLAWAVANLGHKDMIVVGDAGLPVAPTAKRIDLSIVADLPTVPQVLEALLIEFFPEEAHVAKEQLDLSPEAHRKVVDRLGSTPLKSLPHAELLGLAARAKVHVRTGDFTPFANVVLTAGWVGRTPEK